MLPPLRDPTGTVLFTDVERPLIVGGAGVALVVFCVGNRHMCHGYGSLYHSADSGRTWTAGETVVRPGTETIFAGLANAWLLYGCIRVCDSTLRLPRTRDGGVHWRSLRLPAGLEPNVHGSRELQFASPADGFAVSEQEFDPRIHFFRTTDGGMSFHPFEPRVVRG